MEVEQPDLIVIKDMPSLGPETPDKELNEAEQFIFDKTIEVENSSLKSLDINPVQESNSENGKKKNKEEKPPSKIVVRRLPPTMTKDQFLEQVSPLPEIDYIYFVQGNVNDNVNPFSRAYLNFVNQEDLFTFSNTFDNYVFLDAKGQEYPAVVEFNMVQRFPKQRSKKKDPLMGTIEADPAWITFKENLLAEALENSKTQTGKATKQHFFETEISTTEEVNTTPLLEYLKIRRAEKARIREERREEKKRKELERKQKQKAKEKKGEGEDDESPKDVKVLTVKDRRDVKERDRGSKKKDEKEKTKEPRVREFKSRGGKSYQEERLKLAERREEKKREMLISNEKKSELPESNELTESTNAVGERVKVSDEKPIKLERKRYERKGRFDHEDWKEEKKRLRSEKLSSKRDVREKDYSRRNSDKKNNDLDLRRKGKSYKSSDSSKFDKRKKKDQEDQENKVISVTDKFEGVPLRKTRSYDDLTNISQTSDKDIIKADAKESSRNEESLKDKKRSSSLENKRSDNKSRDVCEVEQIILDKIAKNHSKDFRQPENSFRSRRELSKNGESKSKAKEHPDGKGEEKGVRSSKSKSSDACGEKESKESNKSTSRPERRIRNKDRPSIEIYRPGMGKFSKQRLEKEKALGSSTEVDSPSHSPSPTPKSKLFS